MLLFRFVLAPLMLIVGLAGCAGMGASFEPGNELHVTVPDKPSPGAREEKYPVTVRIAPYTDSRSGTDPRQVGMLATRVIGMSGKQIMLDREVAGLAGEIMQKQLGDSGLQVLAPDAKNAQFQLTGSIKTLNVDIRERDYLNIVIESTLTEVVSGKVIWSGMVAEKKDRFAGASGNSKQDVADFLRHGLQVVSAKTGESMLSVLMATRPDLFGLNALVKPVQGVMVHSTAMPAPSLPPATAPAAAVTGTLLLSSMPSRAKAYVDEVYYGLTPLRIELAPGIYPVRLELEGYQSIAEKVSVRSEDRTELEMKLRK